jgi:hypothetical protein
VAADSLLARVSSTSLCPSAWVRLLAVSSSAALPAVAEAEEGAEPPLEGVLEWSPEEPRRGRKYG